MAHRPHSCPAPKTGTELRAVLISCISLILLSLMALPAYSQIVSVLDEHGQRVYINAEPVLPRPGSLQARLNGAKSGATLSGTTMGTPPSSAIRGSISVPAAASNGALPPERLEELVAMTAERHHVDPALVRAVVHTESGGNPAAVSSKGAMGLMQLMPQTAQAMGVTNVFSPQDNLDGGVRYLRTLLERYNGDLDLALAAYNAGAGAVDRARGVPHYRQTQDYVRKVTSSYYNEAAAGDRPKTSLKAKSASTGTNVAAASPPMYQTRDAQGRVVWTNN